MNPPEPVHIFTFSEAWDDKVLPDNGDTHFNNTSAFIYFNGKESKVYEAAKSLEGNLRPIAIISAGKGRWRCVFSTRELAVDFVKHSFNISGSPAVKKLYSPIYRYVTYFPIIPHREDVQKWLLGEDTEAISILAIKTYDVLDGRFFVVTNKKLPPYIRTPVGNVRVAPATKNTGISPAPFKGKSHTQQQSTSVAPQTTPPRQEKKKDKRRLSDVEVRPDVLISPAESPMEKVTEAPSNISPKPPSFSAVVSKSPSNPTPISKPPPTSIPVSTPKASSSKPAAPQPTAPKKKSSPSRSALFCEKCKSPPPVRRSMADANWYCRDCWALPAHKLAFLNRDPKYKHEFSEFDSIEFDKEYAVKFGFKLPLMYK